MSDFATHTLITGATSGIGQSLALRLAASRKLILHGRNPEALEQLRRHCKSPEQHLVWDFDLLRLEELEASLASFLADRAAAVTALVHCAGVAPLQPMRLANLAGIENLMRVNFTSAALVTSTLLRRRANPGALSAIVFVSSIASRFGVNGLNLYSASKGALDALVTSLAVELAPAVRVNSVQPGGLPPRGERTADSQQLVDKLKELAPLGLGTPDDVAATIEFLLSENARWITGQHIVVDGGFTTDATL